ncbi:MAG: hypothetical protein ABI947_22180 [Chloroflexota bacterium]
MATLEKTSLEQTIDSLAAEVAAKRQSLDDALFALQTWFDRNAASLTEAARTRFSQTLNADKAASLKRSKDNTPAEGDDLTLVVSVLRLHAMRLLYRFDERRTGRPAATDTSPYGRAMRKLRIELRETEIAINEARIDAAIANAHNILDDRNANRRWLQDAFARLQTIAHKDLIKLAESVPAPELPPLNIFQRVSFSILGIKQEEIGRRSLQSVRQIAVLQNSQLIEMVKLLAESFAANNDPVGSEQALNLLVNLHTD